MSATAPIALERIEDAIHDWVATSTEIPGARVCFVEERDAGAPDVALPAALILSTSLIPISQPERRKVPSIMQQRITVLVEGPGVFAVRVDVGWDFDAPTTITYTSMAAEAEDVVAAALLVQLQADLPAGLTAIVDPTDDTSLIVTGSTNVPVFAVAAVDTDQLRVVTLRERFPELECEWSRMIWRVNFRATPLRGFGAALDLMARAKKDMSRLLQPALHRAGWRLAGILLAQPTSPADRSESQATLDFAIEGYATAAYQVPAARQIGIALTTA